MIARRLILFTVFVVFSATAAITALSFGRAKHTIKEQIEKRGAILIQAVSKQALDSIRRGDFGAGLEGVVKSLRHDPDVEIAMIIDGDGRILAHSDAKKTGRKLFLSLWDQEAMKSSEPRLRLDTENNRYIIGMGIQGPRSFKDGDQETAFPVGSSSLVAGGIFIGISQERIAQQAEKTLLYIGASAAALLVIATLMAFLFTRKIVEPLQVLGKATQEIAQGNLTAQVKIFSDDEVGRLAAQFNAMTTRLRQTTISKNQLESVVAAKTKALREANESLLEANSHLKRLQELESRFVSMASHELRTPLTSIAGFVSIMQKYADKLSKDQIANYLNTISAEAARLGRMINEILDLKRIEQGRIELQLTSVELGSLANKVVEELRIRPNQPNYRVEITEPIQAMFDEDKTKQIFINLLSNSAKYTPVGKNVTIEIFKIGHSAVINVRDEGPGIPKELWVKLFHPFARANDEVARKTVGSGLGLAITKSLVETMGGKIRAENLSNGAQFTVVLPLHMKNGQ